MLFCLCVCDGACYIKEWRQGDNCQQDNASWRCVADKQDHDCDRESEMGERKVCDCFYIVLHDESEEHERYCDKVHYCPRNVEYLYYFLTVSYALERKKCE